MTVPRFIYDSRLSLFGMAIFGVLVLTIQTVVGFQSQLIGTIAFLLFLIPTGCWLGNILRTGEGSAWERIFFGILTLWFCLSIATTIIYYAHAITPSSALVPIFFSLAIFFKKTRRVKEERRSEANRHVQPNYTKTALLFVSAVVMIDLFLFGTLVANRTTGLLISPWQTLEPWFFLLYAGATGLIIWSTTTIRRRSLAYSLVSLHLLLGFGIAAILYTYGFGFDGFIHRATEEWIKQHGFILPKAPYYIGQYSVVVFLSHLTHLPIFFLDVWYAPVLAAFSLPTVFAATMRRIFAVPEHIGIHSVWIVPWVYFLTLNLTTPHNVVILLMILTVLCTFVYLRGTFPLFSIATFALAAAVTHPLLGVPLLLFGAAAVLVKHTRHQVSRLIAMIALSLSLVTIPVVMFGINNLLQGHGLPSLANPLTNVKYFIELLQRPYWYASSSSFLLEVLYLWQWCIPALAIALGLYGYFIEKKRGAADYLFLIGWASSIAAAWVLRTSVVFPGVAQAEQGNYPYRLLATSVIFLFPFILSGGVHLVEKIAKKKSLHAGLIICAAVLLMLSLYFSYPQRNDKARFPGFNVTQGDFEAVRVIHNENTQYNYVVLSNILTGAAALTDYGFARYFPTEHGDLFYYSIPSGGPLAKLYGNMLYEGQKREYMEKAMALTETKTAYFVVNSYWANFADIVAGAKKTADRWYTVDNWECCSLSLSSSSGRVKCQQPIDVFVSRKPNK